jgi:hypothetical protein
MKKIYKYTLRIVDEQTILTTEGAKVRHVGLDPQGDLSIWYEVYTDTLPALWRVYVVGTGQEIPAGARLGDFIGHDWYHGSVLDGHFVWHIYARPDKGAVPA